MEGKCSVDCIPQSPLGIQIFRFKFKPAIPFAFPTKLSNFEITSFDSFFSLHKF